MGVVLDVDSYHWKSIIWDRELIVKVVRLRIGDVRAGRTFDDPWLSCSMANSGNLQQHANSICIEMQHCGS
ncbi:Hypothetical predicted protein, partial [Olea europaea subsp. europaea]